MFVLVLVLVLVLAENEHKRVAEAKINEVGLLIKGWIL